MLMMKKKKKKVGTMDKISDQYTRHTFNSQINQTQSMTTRKASAQNTCTQNTTFRCVFDFV